MRAMFRVVLVTFLAVAASAPAVRAQSADDLFDSSTLREMRLVVHSTDWAELKATFQENTFYPADLTWNGVTVRNVGIRSRGLGSRSPVKPGLLLRFDRYASGQTFVGQSSLVLDNLTQDPSTMKEVLAMQLFRRVGLPAPREAFVRLYVNNVYLGLYTAVEDVAAPYLQRNLGESNGTLYEYDWLFTYNFDYLGSNLDNYRIFKAQTNTTRSTFDLYNPIEQMVRVANEAPDESFESGIAPFLDLQAFARHIAVENFISDDDGLLGFWGMNNFFLYKREGGSRFQLIPWDKDYTFWRFNNDIFTRVDASVLARRALALPDVRQAYLDTLVAAADSADEPLDVGVTWLSLAVDRLAGLVQGAVNEDPNKPYTTAQFEAAVNGLRTFAARRGAYVRCAVANQSRTPVTCN